MVGPAPAGRPHRVRGRTGGCRWARDRPGETSKLPTATGSRVDVEAGSRIDRGAGRPEFRGQTRVAKGWSRSQECQPLSLCGTGAEAGVLIMLIVHLRYHHPRSGAADVHTDTMLADRVDISCESGTVSRHGEQQVLDLPASARDEQICTALGEPYLGSISVEYQSRRPCQQRRSRSRDSARASHARNHAETPLPVACPGGDW